MDVLLLKTFVEVMAQGSITKAADTLFMTQSAISKRIDKLEQQLGYTLFNSDSKQLIPNKHAYTLLPYAQELVLTHKNFMEAVADELHTPSKLHLGTTLFTTMSYLSPLIKLVNQAQFPFECTYQQIEHEETIEQLRSGKLDLVLSVSNLETSPEIVALPLWEEHFHCIVNKNHPLAHKEQVTLHELVQYPALLTKPGYPIRDQVNLHSGYLKLNLNIKVLSASFLVLQQLVRDGEGWSILPEPLCSPDLVRLPVKDMFKSLQVYLYSHKERLTSKYIQMFYEQLKNWDKDAPSFYNWK